MATTNGNTHGNTPDITLYTNHGCPWAHRAHIALAELGLPFKEEIIDLATPRTAEYLAINPRGLVPTLKYNGEIIPESAIVAQFLADQHPSHLVKTSSEPGGALQRARINFFVDAIMSKAQSNFYPQILANTEEEKNEKMNAFINAIVKEVEPLLKDAAPFFGGSSKLTLAEVRKFTTHNHIQ
jgi:glutathione S-transferase